MALANTAASYGTVTKTFHWLTALLILTAIPLGIGSCFVDELGLGLRQHPRMMVRSCRFLDRLSIWKLVGEGCFQRQLTENELLSRYLS